MSRLWLLYRIELSKLLARRLPLLALLAVVALTLLAPALGRVASTAASLVQQGGAGGGESWENGWTVLAGAVQTARPLLVLVLLVLAGSSVSEEVSLGTLKSILARPVRRVELLLAKLLATWSFGLAVLLVVVLFAALGGELSPHMGLYDVADPNFPARVKFTHGQMASYLWLSVFLTALPLLSLTALGLLASVWFDHPGYATGLAIMGLFLLSALGGLGGGGDWLFVTYLSWPFETFRDLAHQISGAQTKLARRLPLALLVPPLWTLGLFGLAAVSLQRRDVTGAS